MKHKLLIAFLSLLTVSLHASDSMYCPGNRGYVSLGMNQSQVLGACGTPSSKQKVKNQQVNQKVNVKQLIFNNQGTGQAFYGVWSIPTGRGGVQLEVDLIDNKIAAARINGSSVNAFSVCGPNINVDDPASLVYNNCGNPSMTNETFIYQPIPGDNTLEVWTYQQGAYQSGFRLTFINGKLQSIQN